MVTHLTVANGQVKKGTMKSKMMTKKFKQLKAPVQQIVKKKKQQYLLFCFYLTCKTFASELHPCCLGRLIDRIVPKLVKIAQVRLCHSYAHIQNIFLRLLNPDLCFFMQRTTKKTNEA